MIPTSPPHDSVLPAPRAFADSAPPTTPQSKAFAAQMLAVSLERKNAKQHTLDAERALELVHIKAQNACNTDVLRNEVQLAWNNHGAGIISETQMLEIFAECARLAAADPRLSRAEAEWNENKRAPVWPSFKS